ncbi:GFA family protein [Phenylobacterium sp.]|uniref:GFA family protein n=1 Tax=Phenylobacterium sp. TaxID=1871053 RepID=UPI002E3023CE|nr:GFA family protein [Phenylobacterium sp.]HEX3367689.1 GFA family protein [Phenylobacterium sp.]
MTAPYEGGCLCGQVRWRARAEPANVRVCHCRNCQRATGGPFFARAVFLAETFERQGETSRWPTSPRVDRLSCARCGTPVFSEPKDAPARIGVALATLDDPSALAPQMHIWVSAKLAWTVIDDGLPQFAEGPI